ncbi:MAG TPA: M28 family peptidase [Pyrinomonadaceae bacterium]|nr:M28 family peptidase [Pyrinomonadaceae bacterium]
MNEFSSARAMSHLAQIAKAPHPVGSTAHTQVRNYILNELTVLGLKPEVQETSVSNIVARINGVRNSKALLLLGHYDTVQNSPGAGDDSSGVAVMLETARALQASGPLNNDVILLS